MSAEEADKTTTTDASAGDEEEEWLYGGTPLTDPLIVLCLSLPFFSLFQPSGEAGGEDEDSDSDSDDDDDDVRVTIGDIKTGHAVLCLFPVATKLKGVDLDAPGNINGVPVLEVDMESFEEKPWRKPGADLSDYFNYGFNEDTWKAYCEKQKRLRMGLEVSTVGSVTSKITVQQGRTGNEKDISSLPVHTSKPDFTSPTNLYKPTISQVTRISPPQWTGPPPQDMSYYTKPSGTIDVIGGQTATISRVEGRRRHNLEGNNIQVHTSILFSIFVHWLNYCCCDFLLLPGFKPSHFDSAHFNTLTTTSSTPLLFASPGAYPPPMAGGVLPPWPPMMDTSKSWDYYPRRDEKRDKDRERARERPHEREREREHSPSAMSYNSSYPSNCHSDEERYRYRDYPERGYGERHRDRSSREKEDRHRERRHREKEEGRHKSSRSSSRRRHDSEEGDSHRRHKHKKSKRSKEGKEASEDISADQENQEAME
uniref:Pre-mRNA 3'-end-processing factor FIP1 n=1 Tax=Myripristis murdjan TaxID=586833 RepID=A0A667WVY2_9TELE